MDERSYESVRSTHGNGDGDCGPTAITHALSRTDAMPILLVRDRELDRPLFGNLSIRALGEPLAGEGLDPESISRDWRGCLENSTSVSRLGAGRTVAPGESPPA